MSDNSLGSDYYRTLLENLNVHTESNASDAGNVGNNFEDWMAEIDAEPAAGSGSPNNIYLKYERVARNYNNIDPNLAKRIRNHGKKAMGARHTYKKNRKSRKGKSRKTRK